MKEVILASKSPRRRELLSQMGLDYDVVPSNFDEQLDDNRSPDEVARELALSKAMQVAREYPDCIVIGSDTIVTIAGRQLEKPHDTREARDMLRRLSGNANDVTTAVAVVRAADGTQLVDADTTRVYFKPYDAAAVAAYVATGDPMDKAGAYGIQSGAASLIDHIEGHYDTVIGLPTLVLSRLLKDVGIETKPVQLAAPVRQVLHTAGQDT